MLLLLLLPTASAAGLSDLLLVSEVTGEDPSNLANRGRAVATADVDGDALPDLVVVTGGPLDCDGCDTWVHVYRGATGWTTPTAVVGPTTEVRQGARAAGIGDVDGDGYDEVAVFGENEVWVFGGSAGGIGSSPVLTIEASGYATMRGVAGGDVNGDGFADLLVGAAGSGFGTGSLFVHLGGPGGLSAAPDTTIDGNGPWAAFGSSVAAADLDDDGYDEVLVGSAQDGGDDSYAGRVYVFPGSASGVVPTASTTLSYDTEGEGLGISVRAGDIDGDGDLDVIAGSPGIGRVSVFVADGGVLDTTALPLAGPDDLGTALGAPGDFDGDGVAEVPASGVIYEGWECPTGSVVVLGWDGGPTAEATFSGGTGAGLGEATSATDLDGDGFDELLVATGDGGPAWIVPGSATGPDTSAATALQAGAYDGGFADDVAGAGDVNGDGFEDVLVGASWSDAGAPDAGAAFVFHGGPGGLSSSAATILGGEIPKSRFGRGAGVGDMNGDGFDDVAIGARWYAYTVGKGGIYLGSADGVQTEPVHETGTETCRGHVGERVTAAGDLDGDGFADAAFGAPSNCSPASYEAVVVLFGGAAGVREELRLGRPTDHAEEDDFGDALTGGGDVNGDGYDDLVGGMTDDRGVVWLFPGLAGGVGTALDWIAGEDAGAEFGAGLALADVDGDGFDDLVVGAPADGTEALAGEVMVFGGSAAGLDDTPRATLTGTSAPGSFGWEVANIGDQDGDGGEDVVIGGRRASDGAGEALLCTGLLTTCVTFAGTDEEAQGSSVGAADVDGDGVLEALVGAPGATAGALRVYGIAPPADTGDTGPSHTDSGPHDSARDTADTADSATHPADSAHDGLDTSWGDTAAPKPGGSGCGCGTPLGPSPLLALVATLAGWRRRPGGR